MIRLTLFYEGMPDTTYVEIYSEGINSALGEILDADNNDEPEIRRAIVDFNAEMPEREEVTS